MRLMIQLSMFVVYYLDLGFKTKVFESMHLITVTKVYYKPSGKARKTVPGFRFGLHYKYWTITEKIQDLLLRVPGKRRENLLGLLLAIPMVVVLIIAYMYNS